jgi:hypothetical protein
MAQDLTTFLRLAAERDFEPRKWDCGLWIGDWVAARTGTDPCPELRDLTTSAWTNHAMRLPPLVRKLANRAGLKRTFAPQPGDIGVVRYGQAFYGVIKSRLGWAALSSHGVASGPLPPGTRVLASWSVP